MLLAALSTGHKLGLALVGGAFIVFALISAFLIPALRPEYPGRRGLPAFLTLTVALFVGMMFAVFFFGREPKAGQAAAASASSARTTTVASTSTETQTASVPTTHSSATTQTTTTQTTTSQAKSTAPKKVQVSETEFKITLPTQGLTAGSYELDLRNVGRVGHDLVVKGPGVNRQKTPIIAPGKTATLKVTLKGGTYELYCSVDSHKQLGMDLKLKVT